MKKPVDDKDLIVLFIKKILSRAPEFTTEEELREWLRKEIAKPKEQIAAESNKILEEARKQLEDATYLY